MSKQRSGLIALVFLAVLAAPQGIHAQYAADQDSTLVGLRRVYFNFANVNGALEEATATQLQSSIALELRKSGLRIIADPAQFNTEEDAVLNVSIIKIPRSLSTDAMLRIDVEQYAQLARTKKVSRMVTWFYEDNGRNVIIGDFARAAVPKGVNELLNKWLEMNGR